MHEKTGTIVRLQCCGRITWHKIIKSKKDNIHQLSEDAKKTLYFESGHEQLKNRLSNKFSKMMTGSEDAK
jgi:hypothetical protein